MMSVSLISAMWILAWRPIVEPMPLDIYWLWLLVPLAVLIAVAYKAVRVEDIETLPRQAAVMSFQILGFMVGLAVLLWVITDLL